MVNTTTAVAKPSPSDKEAKKCERYLQKMNMIVKEYDETVSSTLIGPEGINLDIRAMRAAARRTLKLAKQLKGVHPPAEVSAQHEELALSLPTLHDFFELSKPGKESFAKALTLAGQVHRTLGGYHQAVAAMIVRHGLDPGLDPVAAEEQAVTQRAMQRVEDWANQAAGIAGQLNEGLQRFMQSQNSAPLPENASPAPIP